MIWVEVLSRHRDVTARLRCDGPVVHIGRGYENDVVLDDPYVAANHVTVFRDDAGRLIAADSGSVNGMFLDRDDTRQERIVIDGERPIRIGQTLIRIREASHAVERERIGRPESRALPVVLAAALGIAVLGIDALSVWLAEIGEPRASNYLTPLLGIAVMVVAWVSIWALLSRIYSGRARFARNLLIALSALLGFLIYNQAARFSAFALTSRTAVNYEYVALWSIVAVACFFHLREVGRSRLKLKAAVVASLLLLVIGVQTLQRSETFYEYGQQNTIRPLMPPALRLAPVRDERAFFSEIERLKTALDGDRMQARSKDAGQ
jgi:hypothetical protein